MKWLWRLCQAPNATQVMPQRLQFYMDPYRMIKKWKSMKIHQKHSKLESLSLSSVFQFISGGEILEGAHDSMVDVRAQFDLLLHEYFVPYLDRTDTICTVDNIFGKNKMNEMKRELKPIRPVHAPWSEQTIENNIEWSPRDAGLLEERDRVLYTDNYYTSIKLAKHMFETYGWTICGTIVTTEKKHQEGEDFPFLKLSNGARNSVRHGW